MGGNGRKRGSQPRNADAIGCYFCCLCRSFAVAAAATAAAATAAAAAAATCNALN